MFESRNSIQDIWGPRTPFRSRGQWPERVDCRITEEPDRWVQSACLLCSNGCGLDIGVKEGRIVGVRGRAVDIVNKGRLGPKGLNGWEANHSADRLRHPLVRQHGKLQPASWDEAMNVIVERTQQVRERYSTSTIGFYTSGQLFLEEYYTLAVIQKAGLGTPHADGNTRLCTATSAAALKETFGADGQAASYFDIDETDCIVHVGHNTASTDTVLWMRVLDRRAGPNPPKLIVIDPRATATAKEADMHLAPRVGTNVALLNGILHLLIRNDRIDRNFLAAHTVGFDELAKLVSEYPPARAAAISGVAQTQIEAAARLIGEAKSLVSTCLQGVYQSNQATAAAVQVNNINLVRGMIGRPGCGILQMNGQPTAQNTRETGADGDLPGFRNWANEKHIEELARLWNVDASTIPHWAPPTHALQIFRYCETGSIRMLWISATNPAVSLPNLPRIRKILGNPELFIVVQDAFMTETTQFADVVLPAALWGEKTGCFTNADRTVHISHKAVEPSGEAKSDFEIFLDFARRMDFRDKDGGPLIKWSTPEEAFEAWKACTRGRPCDYTGLSYAKLSAGSGIAWPCNEAHPDGEHWPYKSLTFPTDADYCEEFGHDLITGAAISPEKYRANNPAGRAVLKPAHYVAPTEQPDTDYPFLLTTGRVVQHFHTRTKTARAPALRSAAPDERLQITAEDAKEIGLKAGDWVRISSRRGSVEAQVTIGDIEPRHVFLPFHFGYWDNPERARAANEMTIYEWDPVSKQPHYKYAAVKLTKVGGPSLPPPEQVELAPQDRPSSMMRQMAEQAGELTRAAVAGAKQILMPKRSHLADYIGLLDESEKRLVRAFEQMCNTHPDEPDVGSLSKLFAAWSGEAEAMLKPYVAKYGEQREDEPKRLDKALLVRPSQGGFDLLRDLHDVWLLVNESMISLMVLEQAARALRDQQFLETLEKMQDRNERQLMWLKTRISQAAPQVLLVPLAG
jgi:anaerobic selenocysteine-containing dehydrogenase